MTDPKVELNGKEILKQLYGDVFVEYAVKNPLYHTGDSLMWNSKFNLEMDKFIKSQQIYE